MSKRDWTLFIKDILASTEKILKFTDSLSKDEFENDAKTFDAVMRNLEIIGEAAKKIPSEIKTKYTGVEWRKIAGLRDIVVHEYFGIDTAIIWDVITNKIPELKIEIEKIISAGE